MPPRKLAGAHWAAKCLLTAKETGIACTFREECSPGTVGLEDQGHADARYFIGTGWRWKVQKGRLLSVHVKLAVSL